MIYALVNSKGGVGKSTTAIHLATFLARTSPTLLIDGDPQASAASWAAWRRESETENPSPITTRLLGKGILEEGRRLSEGFDNAVVDAGGRDTIDLRYSLLLADRAIIPVIASTFDAAAIDDFLELVELAMDTNPRLSVSVLLTRLDTRTKDTGEMVEFIKERSLPLLSSQICERVAYRRVIPLGSTVSEYKRDKVAVAEVEAFYQEVTS